MRGRNKAIIPPLILGTSDCLKKWSAKLNDCIVTITVDGVSRKFKVYSKRAGQCLELLVNQLEEGITSIDMLNNYKIDDNKLFSELKGESGFGPFISNNFRRRENKNVWKIDLKLLWDSTKNSKGLIWFGKHEQTDLQKFVPELLKKHEGFYCNISGIPLLKESKGKFVSNMRKPAVDHRRPKLKGGDDKLQNLQFLSHYINEMKNQICAACKTPKCEQCALAFPETNSTIYPTGEDISYFKNVKKKTSEE